MKKVQKTLTAALAATLATGIVGSVANAETLTEIYNAAYNATQNALAKKDQVSINEARAAIAKLPAEYKNHASTFSGLVDTVQQPIYVNILTALEKAQKENNQANINAARKMLVGVEQSYANTWSAELDKSQQALIVKAQEACAKAEKSQDAKDIAAAKALLTELKTVELNDGLKATFEKMDTDFATNLTIFVEKVEVKNATTIEVKFNKEVNADTVAKENFVIKTGSVKAFAKEVNVNKDVVTVTLNTKLDDTKSYTLTMKGIKDTKGVAIKETSEDFKYEKKEVKSIELKTEKVTRSTDMKKNIRIIDAADRNITEESKVTFTCNEDKTFISKDGKVSASAKLGKEYTITIKVGEFETEQKVVVVKNLAEQIVGFTLGKDAVDKDTKFESINATSKMTAGQLSTLSLFVKNADGTVKVVTGDKLDKCEVVSGPVIKDSKNNIKGVKVGTALLRVTYGDIVETLEIQVEKEGVVDATISLTTDTVSLSNNITEKTVEVTVKDNATGQEYTDATGKLYTWNTDKGEWNKSEFASISNGLIKLKGSDFKKDTRVKLVVVHQGEKVEKEFDVVVNTAGKATGYEVVALDAEGKVVTELEQKQNVTAKIVVFGLDDNGNRVSELKAGTDFQLYLNGSETAMTSAEFVAIDHKADVYTIVAKTKDKNNKFTVEANNSVTLTVKNVEKGKFNVSVELPAGTTTGSFINNLKVDYTDKDGRDAKKVDVKQVTTVLKDKQTTDDRTVKVDDQVEIVMLKVEVTDADDVKTIKLVEWNDYVTVAVKAQQ